MPTSVADLVARFHEHADAYHAGRYNETQIRREFIDPFFKTLGWHVPRRTDATDRQIDMLVCELYGLTDDEIAIVEESHGL